MFLFRSYSSGIQTISTFIHSHSSHENHTRFQTNGAKCIPVFRRKGSKPEPLGAAHTRLYGLFKRVSPRGCYSYERLEGSSKSRLLLCFPEEKHLKMMSLWLRSIQSGLDVYRTLERE